MSLKRHWLHIKKTLMSFAYVIFLSNFIFQLHLHSRICYVMSCVISNKLRNLKKFQEKMGNAACSQAMSHSQIWTPWWHLNIPNWYNYPNLASLRVWPIKYKWYSSIFSLWIWQITSKYQKLVPPEKLKKMQKLLKFIKTNELSLSAFHALICYTDLYSLVIILIF